MRWVTLGLIGVGIVGFIVASSLWSLWVVLIIVGGLAYWFTNHRPQRIKERTDITLPTAPAGMKGGWGRKGDKKTDTEEEDEDDQIPYNIPTPSTGTVPMSPPKPMPSLPPKAEAPKDHERIPPVLPTSPPISQPTTSPPVVPSDSRKEDGVQGQIAQPPVEQPEPEPYEPDGFGGEAKPDWMPAQPTVDEIVLDDIVTEASLPPSKVHFSAYYPKEVQPDIWQPLHAYIYRQHAETQVIQDATKQLGEQLADFRRTTDSTATPLAEGATITATPMLEGFQFNPPSITIGFFKEWHRLDFEIRAKSAPLNLASNGRLTFTVEGVIIADIPLSIFVSENPRGTSVTAHVTQKIYEAIFASYSHHDTQIVEKVERACKSLGLDYLRDVTTLKSGQHWSDELFDLIGRADIFQLFWSSASADSEYVRKEWAYALQLKQKEVTFIRPVYWQQPMPDAPGELSHLHFAFQPDLSKA